MTKAIRQFISRNRTKYFYLMLCLLIGIILGGAYAVIMPDGVIWELKDGVNNHHALMNASRASSPYNAFWRIELEGLSMGNVMFTSLLNNLRYIILPFISGFFIFLLPVIFAMLVVRGFSIGFAVGFFFEAFGVSGAAFVFTALLPQLVIALPAAVYISITALNFYKQRKASIDKRDTTDLRKKYLRAALFSAAACCVCAALDCLAPFLLANARL